MWRWFKRLLMLILLLIIIGGGLFTFYIVQNTAAPTSPAIAAMSSNTAVRVSPTNGWVLFEPQNSQPTTGFIFYPGGLVEHEAYAPHLRDIAAQGFLVVLTPVPLNLAVFDPDAALPVLEAYPQIETWAIGGHSLGGAMAGQFVTVMPTAIDGLVLWASYPNGDLSQWDGAAISIYGTRDGIATVEEIDASRANLPPETEFLPIEGGNHAQFGWYGLQDGDLTADITPQEQQAQIVEGTGRFLHTLGGGQGR